MGKGQRLLFCLTESWNPIRSYSLSVMSLSMLVFWPPSHPWDKWIQLQFTQIAPLKCSQRCPSPCTPSTERYKFSSITYRAEPEEGGKKRGQNQEMKLDFLTIAWYYYVKRARIEARVVECGPKAGQGQRSLWLTSQNIFTMWCAVNNLTTETVDEKIALV